MKKPAHFHSESFRPRKRHGPTGTPAGRRVIKTARTMDAINAAARSGFRPLIKAVRAAPDVQGMVAVFQDPETGEIEHRCLICDHRQTFKWREYPRIDHIGLDESI